MLNVLDVDVFSVNADICKFIIWNDNNCLTGTLEDPKQWDVCQILRREDFIKICALHNLVFLLKMRNNQINKRPVITQRTVRRKPNTKNEEPPKFIFCHTRRRFIFCTQIVDVDSNDIFIPLIYHVQLIIPCTTGRWKRKKNSSSWKNSVIILCHFLEFD